MTTVEREAAYFQSVEEFFVARRGDPLFLSNADWLLVRSWRQAGLPLRVVLRGIADALDAHAHSLGRERKVGSLRYCEAEVEVAYERWRKALHAGLPEADEAAAFLARAAQALETASALGPACASRAREIAAGLRRHASSQTGRRELEAWLASAESELLAALKQECGEQALERMRSEIEADLEPYRERLPERVLEQVRTQSQARRLLEAHGLPRLSLFET
jgi:hypothetical protein